MRMLSIGADPELFVAKRGTVASAIGKLGGSKDHPVMVNGYGIQEDNVLAEFSMPAVSTMYRGRKNFSETVYKGVRTVRDALKTHGLHTKRISSHKYSPDALKKYGPKALEFGCDPDKNAWTGDWNPTPDAESTLRTAGGHVHVGLIKNYIKEDNIRMAVKSMDLFLGVPSVLIDPDDQRRELYGKAGAYRPKPYGFEYRSLSNFWIHKAELREWVYVQTNRAMENADYINLLIERVGEQSIQDCINTGDKELAKHIIHACDIPFNEKLETTYARVA